MKTKLLSYSGAAAAFMVAGSNQLKSQIVYGDIDPDVYVTGDPVDYYMDLNLDGEFEVHFDHFANGFGDIGCAGFVVPNYSYCFISYQYDSLGLYSFAKVFEEGETVLGGFNNAPGYLNLQHADGSSTFGIGPWISPDDKYVGFVFETPGGGESYYAWVRLQVDECGYVIKDYAYSPVPIIAGEGLPVDVCEMPASVDVTGIEAEKAKISWADVAGATAYHVRFRKLGELTWHEKTVDAPKTSIKLKALSCDSEYEWQVQADCAGGLSDYTPINTFNTLSCRLAEEAVLEFSIYPNPVNSELNVNFEESIENGILQIFNYTGALLHTETVNGYGTNVDLSTLPAGMYFITITADNVVQRQEFIKQ